MFVLELFAGSKSFASAAASLGHTTYTSDYDDEFDTDYCVDIFDFDISKLPFRPDVVWASPPCEGFSVASIGHHWNHDNTPKTSQAQLSMDIVNKTLGIIEQLQPKYYFIENPRGKLRKLPFMQDHLYHHTVTYCQYGDTRMKPTDIWTNFPGWKPRLMCRNGAPCHAAAPRGSSTGTQGIKTYFDRSRVPDELCKEILRAIEGDMVIPVGYQMSLMDSI